MRIIHAEGLSAFPLGRLGENEATMVVFNITKWREAFGEGTFALLNRRSGDAAAYPCVIEQDGDEVRWQVRSADLAAAGYGQCELIYTVGDTVAKSEIFKTFVETALNGDADVPEPWEDWVQEVLDAAGRIETATAADIPDALSQLGDDAAHRLVTDEEKAVWSGKQDEIADLSDIRSGAALGATALQTAPVVSVNGRVGAVSVNEVPAGGMADQVLTKTTGGYGWADAQGGAGTTGPRGPAGADGEDGADGFSPTVSISAITGGHRITITDAGGAHSTDVMDGEKGDKGDKGDRGAQGATGPQGAAGPRGAAGAAGKSAYASAQDGGYTDTEAQFNTDLAGVSSKIGDAPSDGKQYARQDGIWAEVQSGTMLTPIIRVFVEDGTVVTAKKGEEVISATAFDGFAVLNIPNFGVWSITGTNEEVVSDEIAVCVDSVREYAIYISLYKIYGVSWDKTANTFLYRTDNAAFFEDPVPFVNDGMTAEDCYSPFDTIWPWSGMVRVTDPAAGELVAIPKFWYKWTNTPNELKLQIANYPADGFYVSPAHADREDGKGERDVVYIGRYHCAGDYKSKTNALPKENITRATARAGIHDLGSNIWMNDFALFWTTRMLYLVEYANWDSQNAIGYGSGNNSEPQTMGYTDSMPYHTGTMLSSKWTYGAGTQWRNIEGLWDNVFDWCDGIRFSARNVYCYNDPSTYSDSSGGTLVYSERPTTPNFISAWNVPEESGFEWALFPSSTQDYQCYIADVLYYGSSDAVLCVGGCYSQVQDQGMFCLGSNGDVDYVGTYIGARLQKLP